jgi:CO/xanthine dehydrogenase Mo-binding subunit
MGIGSALFEATAYADGHPLTTTLADYQVPTFKDVPPFTAEILERPGADVHGLGETALPLVPAAVGNALRSLGLAQARMPVSPESVLVSLASRSRC